MMKWDETAFKKKRFCCEPKKLFLQILGFAIAHHQRSPVPFGGQFHLLRQPEGLTLLLPFLAAEKNILTNLDYSFYINYKLLNDRLLFVSFLDAQRIQNQFWTSLDICTKLKWLWIYSLSLTASNSSPHRFMIQSSGFWKAIFRGQTGGSSDLSDGSGAFSSTVFGSCSNRSGRRFPNTVWQ